VSDYSFDRAVLLGLISQLSSTEKDEFKREVQDQLGLAPGQDCDSICGAMDDQEFREFVEYVKDSLQRKKRRLAEVLEPAIYA
jgi:hypothetical protein